MRLRYLLVPLTAAALTACRSAETQGDVPEDAASPPVAEEPAVDPVVQTPMAAAETPVVQEGGRDVLQEEGQLQALKRQRAGVLVENYVAQGAELLDRADLEGALQAYANALEVDPGSQAARAGLRQVEALMGERFSQAAEFMEDAAARETVRRAQARMAADKARIEGDSAMAAGDYGLAIQRYREAQTILRFHPLVADSTLDEHIVGGLLDRAADLLEEARLEEERQRIEVAQAAREAEEQAQREYRENKLRTLYREANAAFLAENFRRSESLAQQILVIDPKNQAAVKMRDIAQAARHRQTDQQTRRRYREEWLRTFEELDTMDIPQTESLVFDDLKRWREVDTRVPSDFSASDPLADADRLAVASRLEGVRFAPNFIGTDGDGAPLEEIAAFLQNLTGVNFLISPRVLEDLDEEETTIRLVLNERSVRKVLDLINDTSENLRWKIDNGTVRFVTREELVGGQTLKMYEVRDIIHPVPHFPGRDINVSPSGGFEPPDEDIEEREGLVVTSDALESLIRDNIATESWDEDPQNAIRITDNGTLVVNQTPEVQAMIQDLLEDLREATGIMVDIQTNFLKVEDNFLEDIGVDFRGLGQPGLGTNAFFNDFGDASTQQELGNEIGQGTDLGAFYDEGNDGNLRARVEQLYDMTLGDPEVMRGSGGLSFQWTYLNDLQMELILRAVSKSERIQLVTAPRLLVFNTARANITVLNQVAYVQDFDVEIAQAASIADPIVAVIQDGVVLDVRPVVSADRRFILMELRPTVAELKRPIEEVATTIGSQASVTIQLPEVDIQRVRTTIPMPDGGTVMLGGLKVSEKQDYKSGVPILNRIPVLSFFFDRKGQYTSNRKLLILLKATIVIPEEHEPTPAQSGLMPS